MGPEDRDPALDRLDALVGEWELQATPPGGPPWEGEARASFEWLKGRLLMLERATMSVPEFPDGVMLIGSGDEPGSFRQHYFDSRGVRRVYEMTLDGGVWKLWRDDPDPFPQRFSAEVGEEGDTIEGRWEKALDGSTWEVDFDLTYRRLA